jgi:hypothetical protein
MRRIAASVAAALLCALPATSWAQRACDAERDRIEDAINRFREDDFEGAERGLTFASRSCPTDPSIEGVLGLAPSRTGHLVEAERHLQAALASARHPWIVENRPVLERRLGELQGRLGSLMVTADARDAVLLLPDERRVVLPMSTPVRVQAGSFTLRVSAAGHREATREVEVAPGAVRRERFDLAPSVTPDAPAAAATPPSVLYLRDQRTVTHESTPWRTVGLVTAGVGAALAVAGVVQFARSASQGAATRDASPTDGGRYGAWATWRQGFGADATADELCAAADGASSGSVDVLSQVRGLCADNATTRATALMFTLLGAALTGTGVAVAARAGDRARVETSAPRVVARADGRTQGVWLTVPF